MSDAITVLGEMVTGKGTKGRTRKKKWGVFTLRGYRLSRHFTKEAALKAAAKRGRPTKVRTLRSSGMRQITINVRPKFKRSYRKRSYRRGFGRTRRTRRY